MFNLNESEESFELKKSNIIHLINEEEVFNAYGIPFTHNSFKNPIREESKASCSFYRNKSDELYLIDYSGWFNGNCFDFVMFMERKTFKEALLLIYENFVQGKNIPITVYKNNANREKQFLEYNKTEIIAIPKEFEKSTLSVWSKQGITEPTLKKYKVRPVERADVNSKIIYRDTFTFKCYLYYFAKVDGLHRVKLYFPGSSNKFLTNSKEIEGLRQLKKTDSMELVITKSLKDVMLLWEFGIASIAPPSERFKFSEELINELKRRGWIIYSLYDFDFTGVKGMQELKKTFGIEPILLQKRREFVKIAKDLTDHYKLLNSPYLESLKNKNLTIKQLVLTLRELLDESNSNTKTHKKSTIKQK